MTKHILVPLDGSEPSWAAFEHALDQYEGERITVLHVADPSNAVYTGVEGGYYDGAAFDRALERGEELCDRARERLEEAGTDSSTVLETAVERGRPARTIVRYGDDHDVDLVVIGSHGRSGVSRVLLGSVAETVVRRAAMPVTVVR
ncbi:universal stress protein [Natronorubrum sp. JWXQ-INN-674]|uniref:Universal stress protein n=1 Tax=Natronorubrum halalkaliphilum TaxID=2691917 RepID=A0A6B0VQY5_9EURY|nr:universal stress protein [Natronorubrum halalkaliphilum]MXV63918.1 universal stress protein [Natronorubrum halalkaliphilum]